MGIFDKMKDNLSDIMGMNRDEYDEMENTGAINYDENYDGYESDYEYEDANDYEKNESAIKENQTGGEKMSNWSRMQMVIKVPKAFDESSEIADHIKGKRIVGLNLRNTDKDTARRMIDFISGTAYATRSKIMRVDVDAFIIVPENVEIDDDAPEGFFRNGVVVKD